MVQTASWCSVMRHRSPCPSRLCFTAFRKFVGENLLNESCWTHNPSALPDNLPADLLENGIRFELGAGVPTETTWGILRRALREKNAKSDQHRPLSSSYYSLAFNRITTSDTRTWTVLKEMEPKANSVMNDRLILCLFNRVSFYFNSTAILKGVKTVCSERMPG